VKATELTPNQVSQESPPAETNHELLSALAGTEAARDRVVANRTRRVVLTSLGVIKDQKANRKRGRALAAAAILLMILVLGPFLWHVADDIIGGEHLGDVPIDTSLLVCILCAALLAAVLIAGWRRK
jgi:hypothetical protein